jgi:hypothetical protein
MPAAGLSLFLAAEGNLMMCWLYSQYRSVVRNWYVFAVVMIGIILLLNLYGFAIARWQLDDYVTQFLEWLRIPSSDLPGNVESVQAKLGNVKDWLGLLIWSITALSVFARLFAQPALNAFVAILARQHVVLSGLENGGERVVKKLRDLKRNVVVLESNLDHSNLEGCRNAGAVCLKGSVEDAFALNRAQLRHARGLIVLGNDERANMNALSSAALELERPIQFRDRVRTWIHRRSDHVKCVIEVNEPGLLAVLRKHPLYLESEDRLELGLFNVQEMTARAMLRETMLGTTMPAPNKSNKFLVVGTGRKGRMGEALVFRAIKDHYLENPDSDLEIHVFDEDAEEWARCVTERASHLYNFHAILPINCPASRCGFLPMTGWDGFSVQKYKAIFVCLEDESLAIMQASRISDLLHKEAENGATNIADTPIVVCVREEITGFGPILREQNGIKPIANVHTVGTQNRIFDIVSSMDPENELIAQVLHQDYLAVTQKEIERRKNISIDDAKAFEQKKSQRAFRPWTMLDETYRKANLELARRLPKLLKIPDEYGHTVRKYDMVFAPNEEIHPNEYYNPTEAEINLLAIREHEEWMKERKAEGYYGPECRRKSKTYHENIVDWHKLDEGTQEYDRNIVRRLATVLAKADYKLVPVTKGCA